MGGWSTYLRMPACRQVSPGSVRMRNLSLGVAGGGGGSTHPRRQSTYPGCNQVSPGSVRMRS